RPFLRPPARPPAPVHPAGPAQGPAPPGPARLAPAVQAPHHRQGHPRRGCRPGRLPGCPAPLAGRRVSPAWRALAQRLGLALLASAALLFAPPFEDAYALPQRLALSLAGALLALAAPPRLPLGRLALLLLAWLAWRVLSHAVAQPPLPVADWLATQAPL